MSGELREAIRGVRERVESTDRVVAERGDRTDVLAQLTGADYISLGALFVGWGSALLFLRGEPNWALLVMFGAFLLDKLDGWYARRAGVSSPFGRRVDSFIDIFAYIVPGALLYHVALAPNDIASLVVGFLLLAFGGLSISTPSPLTTGRRRPRNCFDGRRRPTSTASSSPTTTRWRERISSPTSPPTRR